MPDGKIITGGGESTDDKKARADMSPVGQGVTDQNSAERSDALQSDSVQTSPSELPICIRDDGHWIELTEGELPVDAVDQFLRNGAAGGVVIFVGTTREWTAGRQTQLLEYEAHNRMAFSEMVSLADRASDKWPLVRVCILHRLGRVDVTEASVVIGVSTAHRADSFEASRFLIDTLKEDVPIWKKESFVDGNTKWVNDPVENQ